MSKVWRRLWLVTREDDWLHLVVSVERGSASVHGRALRGVKGDFRVPVQEHRRSTALRTWTFLKCSPICARSVNISRRQSWCWSVLREDTANGVGVHPRG